MSDSISSGGPIVRIPVEDGGDPLVRSYLGRFRATCALSTFAWRWIFLGGIAVLLGGAAGSWAMDASGLMPASPPVDLRGHGFLIDLIALLDRTYSSIIGTLVGMLSVTLLTSTVGSRLGVGGVPAGQEPWLAFAVLASAYLLLRDPMVGMFAIGGAVCLIYATTILFRLLAISIGHVGQRSDELSEPLGGWPVYTVLVPLYRERNVAGSILASLAKLDYPRSCLDVKFLLEADDAATLEALVEAGIPAWAEVVVVPEAQPRTKPRACNHGLARARGAYLVIFDAEDRPEPDQLKQAVLEFARQPPEVVCLQAQLAYHNHRQNLLTRWFALEYNVWFRRYLGGLVRLGLPIPLGGTSNHFRAAALKQLGGWDPFNVTEDCDLGVRLHLAGMRTQLLDSVTWEEANSRVGNWIRQRSRWLKGYLVTHLVWFRQPLRTIWLLGGGAGEASAVPPLRLLAGCWYAFGFLLSVLFVPVLAGLNIVLWAVTTVYLVLIACDLWRGYSLGELIGVATSQDRLDASQHLSWPMVYLGSGEDAWWSGLSQVFFCAAICLFVGNLAFVLIAALAGRRPGQRGLWWAALLSPLYWVLISIGAWKGIAQLLTRPHYWEKTVHGLDRPAPPAPAAPPTA